MKGLLGLVFLGICIVIAAALLAGAMTFPEAMAFMFGVMFWIIVIILVLIAAFFALVLIALHEERKTGKKRKSFSIRL